LPDLPIENKFVSEEIEKKIPNKNLQVMKTIKSRTMKKLAFFLIAGLVASCSSDDILTTESSTANSEYSLKKASNAVQIIHDLKTQHTEGNYSVEQIIALMETAAFKNSAFNAIASKGYEPITALEINYLLENPLSNTVTALPYSQNLKNTLLEIISNTYTGQNSQGLGEYEMMMAHTCNVLYDTGDDTDRDARVIAYAYGYQKSEANAVMFTAIITVLLHQ